MTKIKIALLAAVFGVTGLAGVAGSAQKVLVNDTDFDALCACEGSSCQCVKIGTTTDGRDLL